MFEKGFGCMCCVHGVCVCVCMCVCVCLLVCVCVFQYCAQLAHVYFRE